MVSDAMVNTSSAVRVSQLKAIDVKFKKKTKNKGENSLYGISPQILFLFRF